MTEFTPTQGRYLAFIRAYTSMHGYPPAETEIATAMCVSPPSVNQMVKMLERKELIVRHPGVPRSIEVLVPDDELPEWNHRAKTTTPPRAGAGKRPRRAAVPSATASANLYVISVFLSGGPVDEKFVNKEISRVIEIRGDQTLEDLHNAIFEAFDRWECHMYEFQLGKRPFDPKGPTYGTPSMGRRKEGEEDAGTVRLDDLKLKPERVFGYWFDFGDDWFHQLRILRIEKPIRTVTYPRVMDRRVGKSPPQYKDE